MLSLFTSFALHKVMIRASLLVVDDTRCFYGAGHSDELYVRGTIGNFGKFAVWWTGQCVRY